MRSGLIAASLLALASCASTPRALPDGPPAAAPPPPDARAQRRLASHERAWLVAHLADDPDPSNPRESDAVRRLSAMDAEALRATAEVFRVGDARRAPFARRVFERYLRRVCDRDDRRVARSLRAMQGIEADAGEPPRWRAIEGPWPNELMERIARWVDEGARCAP